MVQFFRINQNKSKNEVNIAKYNLCDEGLELETYEQIDYIHDLLIVSDNVWLSKNCLRKLREVANNNPEIGTVSPLFSVDFEIMECIALKNRISKKESDWEEIIEACASPVCPEVTRNILECVYVKKEVLQETGLLSKEEFLQPKSVALWFDEVQQLGWKNKICGQAVAIGNALFEKSEKYYTDRLTSAAKEMMNWFNETVALYDNLHYSNGRHNIMHYLLADFQEGMRNNVGGTQFHVADLVEYQRDSYNVYVLARDGAYLRLTEYTDDEKKQFDFYVGEAPIYNVYYDPTHEKIYELILRSFAIELVHVHHTMWMPLNIYDAADKMGIPIIVSLHDYYYVCPQLVMLRPNGELCTQETCRTDCQECLKQKKIMEPEKYIEKWHLKHKEALDKCQKIIFPSQYAKRVVLDFYPTIENRTMVIEHGIKLPEDTEVGDPHKQHPKLKIAFIGGISDIKGGKLINQVIRQDDSHFEWYIMGGIASEDLINLKKDNLTKTGWYKKNEIYQLLRDYEIDIVCIWSIVAETFCYTLSEALSVGIPVIATHVGALGDRVEALKCGWLIDRNASLDEALKLLCDLDNNREKIIEKRKAISKLVLKDIAMMGKEYDEVYSELIDREPMRYPDIKSIMQYKHNDNISDDNADESKFSVSETDINEVIISAEDNMRFIASEKELNELKSSLLVKVAIQLRKVKIPGKQKIKDILMNKKSRRL